MISLLFTEMIPNKLLAATELNKTNFVLQNTVFQQSIVKGVLKMYLIKKIAVIALAFICMTITISYAQYGNDEGEKSSVSGYYTIKVKT